MRPRGNPGPNPRPAGRTARGSGITGIAGLAGIAVFAAFALVRVGAQHDPGASPSSPGAASTPAPPHAPAESAEAGPVPSEWFLLQRAWPDPDVKPTSRLEAWEEARALRSASFRAAGAWDPAGPTNVGGRIADVAVHPTNASICYAGAAEGGVFKTTDGGSTWFPVFDEESSLSIGSITIDPNDPEVIWVGTGESNGGGGSVTYGGTGVFRSGNGGVTWANTGLPDSRAIGRIVVDPTDPERVFVAVLGALFSTDANRGVYRTTDSGTTWQRVLASTDSTGAIDVAIHPGDPNRVYAAMWERIRYADGRDYGGPTSGIFRSTDGGDTWSELTNGLPSGPRGRIGFSIASSSPEVMYAIYADADPGFFDGVYKTTNGGDSWVRTNDGALANMYSSFGWWFGNIRVDPSDPDRVFVLGLEFYRTTNGGSSWQNVGSSMHVDHHALEFGPDPQVIWEGNDGGMYKSVNGGSSWSKLPNLPVTQFYTVEVDHQLPERLYGGTQDNGTNRTTDGGLSTWQSILGGDGFYCQIDPTDNDFVWAESQNGNLRRSTNGGSSFSNATSGLFGRRNWSMPVMLDPSDPTRLYTGTDRVFRSVDRGASWSAISADLTDGPGGGNVTFGTITTVAVAETDPAVIWAGTDDANVWVTTDGGGNWSRVDSALPERWITRVAIDPTDATVAYTTVSGFRWDEPFPHVLRTTDSGATWADISANLPQAPVNDIVIDPDDPSALYVATDFGAYVSRNTGASWTVLGSGLPNTVVTDLEIHVPTRTLVAATYGRSMWKIPVDLDDGTGAPEIAAEDGRAPRLALIAPNPSRGGMTLEIVLPRAAFASVDVFDTAGRRVATLAERSFDPGRSRISWNGRDRSGQAVAPGTYFARLVADGVVRTSKLTRLR